MILVKRRIPLAIAFVFGIIMIAQHYIPHPYSKSVLINVQKWAIIVFAFSLVVGLSSLLRLHIGKIRRRVPGWGYSMVTVAALGTTAVLGFAIGTERGTPFDWIFQHMYVPMQATVFSILAFFIASAAYKAFRARNLEAAMLLLAAIIVMLGNVPIGQYIWKKIPVLQWWIMNYPNMAAMRGIIFGVALGTIATSLRIIFGIERAYLGGGE